MNLILRIVSVAAISAAIIPGACAHASEGEKQMHAKGTFEVKVTPAEASPAGKDAGLSCYSLEKTFHGDMEGSAKGEMLASMTESTGAMAYVAMDHVTGRLGGRSGSFYLAHTATMKKGDPGSGVMKIIVVKDSGTGGLSGLSGELKIIIDAKGGHSYVFDYELP